MKRTRGCVIFWFFLMALSVSVHGAGPKEQARCEDKDIGRVESPDGSLVAAMYHRSCWGGTQMTYATLEKPRQGGVTEGEVECYLLNLQGFHPLEVIWKDSRHITLSTPDRLGQGGIISQSGSCNNIEVSYDIQVEPPLTEAAPNPKVAALIREALLQSDVCIKERSPGVRDSLYCMLDREMHRTVLSLMFKNLLMDKCSVTKETYDRMKEAGMAMGFESGDWEALLPQVK